LLNGANGLNREAYQYYPIYVYSGLKSYQVQIQSQHFFYLLFDLTKENRKQLLKIVHDCINNDNFKGVIFSINKNELILDRLFFLKEITINIISRGKSVGIWGIPYCYMQSIFGSYNYSLYVPRMIPPNSFYFSEYDRVQKYNSLMLSSCQLCVKVDTCHGLGNKKENQYIPFGRVSHYYRMKGRDQLVKGNDISMQKIYRSFAEHIDRSDLTYADRYVYFIKNLDLGSEYSFENRFVYHCDYLPKHELEVEWGFLVQHTLQHDILYDIRTLHEQERISRIAYSKVKDSTTLRESFYVSPNNEHNKELLDHFKIDLNVGFSYKLYGVGIDFYNGKIKSYKVYCIVEKSILLRVFPEYIKRIGIDIENLNEEEHYFSLRFDEKKQKVSDRIDLIYNDLDYKLFKPYIDQQRLSKEFFEQIYVILFGFEFEGLEMKKINMYYQNRFVPVRV
jgi:hypothetical protein